jgi:hypothetical protein
MVTAMMPSLVEIMECGFRYCRLNMAMVPKNWTV